MRELLQAAATRNTAIACYQAGSSGSMQLLWSVGDNRAFLSSGTYPVKYQNPERKTIPSSLRHISMLTKSAGYLHDWGKTSEDFAHKLAFAVGTEQAAGELPDEAFRHELLSYWLLKGAMAHGFDDAWKAAFSDREMKKIQSLKKGFSTALGALEYIILTHHKLLGHQDKLSVTGEAHIKGTAPVGGVQFKGKIDSDLYRQAMSLLDQMDETEGRNFWRLPATLGRTSMILADHFVSSCNYGLSHGTPEGEVLYANTKRDVKIEDWNNPQAMGIARFDQPLDWHLRSVGDKAEELAYYMMTEDYPGLSQKTVDTIMEESSLERFQWQDNAVRFIKEKRVSQSNPCLIFSGAGTGAGKTRANAKFACALSDKPRFCIGLNLRSLTLQTGDSMREDLNITDSEMAVVIGDRVGEKMHEASTNAFVQRDDKGRVLGVDVSGPDLELPPWLSSLGKSGGAKQTSLIMPPVLVSTIDFIINASEPQKQGHHALAIMRMMNSDLILDELDSYDPVAMVSVMRLIQMTAMLGRSVICSSATLSVPVAKAVHEAFCSGLRMREAEQRYTEPQTFIIDDELSPECYQGTSDGLFSEFMEKRHERLIEALDKKPAYRKAIVIDGDMDADAYFRKITRCVEAFHDNHKWVLDREKGLIMSLGLIRVANIGTAIGLASHLSRALGRKGARIACYHANELKIQRHLKEKKLDKLLNRKKDSVDHIKNDEEIMKGFASGKRSVPFIVIATPVEEVGRDHDFDWAIIEPSSAQSIVQTAGRVNRHRLVEMTEPNIAIMDYNLRSTFRGHGVDRKPCFEKPGFESESSMYGSAKISEMLPAGGKEYPLDKLDAEFRLGKRLIARDEDRIISRRMAEGMDILLERKGYEGLWMTNAFYHRYPLRGHTSKDRYRLIKEDGSSFFEWEKLVNSSRGEEKWEQRPLIRHQPEASSWLHWSDDELASACKDMGIEPEEGMALEIARYDDNDRNIIYFESFGFMMET